MIDKYDIRNSELIKLGLKIGRGVQINAVCYIDTDKQRYNITLGDYVTIGYMASLLTHCPIKSMHNGNLKINICHDVFIGAHAIILPGITIGPRTIIGAGSVVSNDVSSDSIYAGNPAKFIKLRDPFEVIRTRLLMIQKKLL